MNVTERPSVILNRAIREDDTLRLVERLNSLVAMGLTVKAYVIGDEWIPVHRFFYTKGDDFFTAESNIPGYGPFGYGISHQHTFHILTLECQYSDDCVACTDPLSSYLLDPLD